MAECRECLYYEVCADFRRNICETDQKRFEEYKINSNGICDIFDRKTDFQKVIRCKDCKHATFYSCKNDACYKAIICEYKIGIGDENFYCACAEPRTPKERGGEK